MADRVIELRKYDKRLEGLRNARSNFMSYWGELSDYHWAHRGQFLLSDHTRGSGKVQRNTRQYNNTSHMAARSLASGMMAGISSPSRPWFQLGVEDEAMNEFAPVKQWLKQVENILYRIFARSNVYNMLHILYGELGVFGTAAMGVYANFDNVIQCKTYTIGSYMLSLNGEDEVDTFYREYQKGVGQLVKEFGIDAVSSTVRNAWSSGNLETLIDCVHAVEPNDDRDHMSPFAVDMPVRSVYYEKAALGEDKFLRKSGFEEFPLMCPRWAVTTEDVYGNDCPGMLTLGDTKALQLGMKRKFQAVDKVSNPPLIGDNSLVEKTKGTVPPPGSVIYQTTADGKGLASIYGNYRPDISAIRDVNADSEFRIKKGFYEDLFLMLVDSDRRQPITATEVVEKREEKLLMLGPVLERLHQELLDPLIDRTFNIAQRAGIFPPPPQEIIDKKTTVTYISLLAQAQRMVAVSGLQRVVGFAAGLVEIWPEARHKIDAAQVIDEYAEAMGVDPSITRSDDEVEALIANDVAQAQAAQQQQQQQVQLDQLKTASEINTGGPNALNEMLQETGLQ